MGFVLYSDNFKTSEGIAPRMYYIVSKVWTADKELATVFRERTEVEFLIPVFDPDNTGWLSIGMYEDL